MQKHMQKEADIKKIIQKEEEEIQKSN
jgi:hypothetical protein